ncbi:MAG: hypothetical protein CVT49_09590 [candidate division Zixibacteria bacterium HGW-Zixibacteria-1]|nr:MAG: hypothetical protein CVT49_09590 [candidate division Zixibacteria bacterium HGW-Zixibacteria-1]
MKVINDYRGFKFLKLLTISLFIMGLPAVMPASSEPIFNPQLVISRTNEAIDIDGKLNDPGWKRAAHLSNFVERYPGDNIEPLVETEALVTYDHGRLYVAFICKDDPANIRATMCQRDQFGGDDAVIVLLDSYGDANWAYEFQVNPYGVQKDLLWTNIAGEDSGYDLIWESSAKITDSGYQVEIAIPFSSIRFPSLDVQNWKMDFWRVHPRDSYHQYSWSANDRNQQCWPCQWGTVTGIGDVKPGKGLEVLPSLISNQSGSMQYGDSLISPYDDGKIDGEMSLGGKYSISSDITLEGTYNPDFSQVETDAAQIDVNSTVALFYPERRPFFQEGIDIFRTLFNSFYTRTINDPQFAAKLTGRYDGYRFGFLSAIDENTQYIIPFDESSSIPLNVGKSYVNVLRGIKSLGNYSHVGFIVNDRRFEDDGYNTILGLDENIRLTQKISLDGQYLVTFNKELDNPSKSGFYNYYNFNFDKNTAAFDGETFTGYGLISRLRHNSRSLNFNVTYSQVDPTYRTEIGYDPWVNYRDLSSGTNVNFYPKSGIFERITPRMYMDTRWKYDGEHRWYHVFLGLEGNLRYAQSSFNVNVGRSDERWYGVDFNNLWSFEIDLNSRPSSKIAWYAGYNRSVSPALNQLVKGNEHRLDGSLTLKPIDRMTISPSMSYTISHNPDNSEELYENLVSRTRLQYQLTRALSFRLIFEYRYREVWYKYLDDETEEIVRYNSAMKNSNIFPLLTYRINPFTIFYVGMTGSYNDLGQSAFDGYFSPRYYEYNQDIKRNWSLDNRQFFMKLQYLFQT